MQAEEAAEGASPAEEEAGEEETAEQEALGEEEAPIAAEGEPVAEAEAEVLPQNSRLDGDLLPADGPLANYLSSDGGDQFTNERIQRILDIELPVNISFGSTKRPLGEVLKLGPGALLELDRAADEPVILKVNNRVFAKGEIVDVDGYYGVQITEITPPVHRIVSLGD
jgi:flagellar motor switch protein FliN